MVVGFEVLRANQEDKEMIQVINNKSNDLSQRHHLVEARTSVSVIHNRKKGISNARRNKQEGYLTSKATMQLANKNVVEMSQPTQVRGSGKTNSNSKRSKKHSYVLLNPTDNTKAQDMMLVAWGFQIPRLTLDSISGKHES